MAPQNSFSQCTAGDPKFWPAYIRHLALANICLMVFLANMYTAGITTGFGELAVEFYVGNAQLVNTISYPVLALGVGNVFWTPTAVCFGKRPTIIVALVVFLACTIWSIKATTFNSLVASRVVACFAGGSIDSLGPAIVADLYMERYFATAMAIFSLCLSGGSQIGPMIAGFLIGAKGWRWLFILCAILAGVNLVLMLLFFPETNYRRVLYKGETAQEADKEAVQTIEENNKDASGQAESTELPLNSPYAGTYWRDLVNFRNRGTETRGLLGWPRQFSLPFRFLLVPQVLFATISYGVFLGGAVMIATVAPQLLSPPPYLFTSSGIGLFALSSFIGIVIAYPIAGPFTDYLSRFFGRRSHAEVHVPEYRMPALIMPFAIAPAGLLVFAYTLAHGGSAYAAAAGYAMQVSALAFVPSVVLSVVVDGWPATGSEALVLINAGKNAVAFGLTLSTPDWLAKVGLVKMFWDMAAIQWAVLVLAVPLYFFGPWARQKTLWLV
ncbi:MFS transporter [Hyaloscypha variabilis F]|uniref:MFS transporter n=1 Tax=Hyaloscypha variabilis (strain UAMH 11265 / GT02V1 / F) TaxID=1149755 RepID=A0A2J6SAB7_HYAVF|nr:MFS transporter [Hyaloscypha variabilis F]